MVSSGNERWKWWICIILLFATTLNYLDRMALNQTAFDIKLSFQLNDKGYAGLEVGFQVAFGLGALLSGYIVDRYGVYYVYPIVVFGWSLFGFLTGFASDYWSLLFCRIGLGIFEAGNWPCGIRTVKHILNTDERALGNAIFHSGTGLGAMITPLIVMVCILMVDPVGFTRLGHMSMAGAAAVIMNIQNISWQYPFRVIGVLGLAWIILWLLFTNKALFSSTQGSSQRKDDQSFLDVLKDRRYWLLILVVTGVNTTWHTYRVWLPLFLQTQLECSREEMALFTFTYFATADVGAWLIGLLVIILSRRYVTVSTARLIAFGTCVFCTVNSYGVQYYNSIGDQLTLILIHISAFGSLGLFATYFTLSQELSEKHQGKVTGSLGAVNSLYLSIMYYIQGTLADVVGGYERLLALAFIPALIAFIFVILFWPRQRMLRVEDIS
jgi:MFS transporter, ACS family, hexuronate transporter